jgi:tRNA G37 N-methylase Trm5
MGRFVGQDNLPPYYKVKGHIVLSSADEENEPWENLAATRYHLREAEKALVHAKQTYVTVARDRDELEFLGKVIQEEWDALRAREAAVYDSE